MKLIDDLLAQEVDRKKFLLQVGGLLVGLLGLGRILRALSETTRQPGIVHKSVPVSQYGGAKSGPASHRLS